MISEGTELRRTRVCSGKEAHRFHTYERAQRGSVRKGSGAIEPFDRGKLERGLMTAVSKRPVDSARITAFIDDVSDKAVAQGIIDSKFIGELALALLRELDDVSYVRFLSVYRDFGSLTEFRDEIARLRPSLQVHKRSGRLEPFDRSKALAGLGHATNRRRMDYRQLEAIVDGIVMGAEAAVISSADVGRLAMQALRPLDEVAYIRFASVYYDFNSADDFVEALARLAPKDGDAAKGGGDESEHGAGA